MFDAGKPGWGPKLRMLLAFGLLYATAADLMLTGGITSTWVFSHFLDSHWWVHQVMAW